MTSPERFHHRYTTFALLLACALMLLAGCQHNASAKLPAGALNTFDADSYRVLSDAHAAIQSIHDDATSGKLTLDQGQRTLVDRIIVDNNTADHLYKAYHANAGGDTAALTQSIQLLIGDLASLSKAFPTQTTAAPAPAK